MDPRIITADDKSRASGGSLRSPDFRRMVGLVWPHRRFITVGLIASIFFGLLHSVSIVGVLPVLKVMLAKEGLHGWIYRSVASERLDVRFDVRDVSTGIDAPDRREVVITKIHSKSPLEGSSAADYDAVTAFRILPADAAGEDDTAFQPAYPFAFFEAMVQAGEGATVELVAGQDDKSAQVQAQLQAPSLGWSLLRWIGDLIPREQTRQDRVNTLIWVLSIVVGLALLSNVARFIAQYYLAIGVLRGVMDLRRTLYRKVLRLPMDFFTQNVADLVSRFVQDAQEIQRGLIALFGKLLLEPIKAFFLLVAALWIDTRTTLALLIVMPLALLLFWAVGRKIRKANKRLLQAYGMMLDALGTTLHAIGVVKAYNAENLERRRLWQIDRRMFGHLLRITRLEAFLRPLLEVLAIIGIAAITVWLGAQVIAQQAGAPGRPQLGIDDFATLVLVLGMLVDPLRKLSDVYPRVVRSSAGARRIFSVIDAPEESELYEGAVELSPLSESIEFRDVNFTYPNAAEPALRNVNLTIHQGETVAIVGANGSGKTTLTKLLNRFHDPQSGVVLMDGLDIRRAKLRSLRKQISVVTQDPVVFAMTIADNIAYGARNVTPEMIAEAARRAHADEFIKEKPNGYDERVGERGSTLSGGQRQRLCIARAMMRNAPILVFDEATSQIDSESEQKIQDAIRDYARGRTTILIAHRLSTIRFAKRVIVMEAGQVVDSGTHLELIARCQIYATLCRTQLME